MGLLRGALAVAAWALGPALAWAAPSPSPLPIRAISVDVVPIHAGPGLSLPAPPADRLEHPVGGRRFQAVSPARLASPSPSPRPRAGR
ncbi:MAG: hypothetical protein VKQ33_13055 [Candidatus Sericytochromatia bacterium]|nr:hypothetical protein [Candidatus Sericytochromatia bacterium]